MHPYIPVVSTFSKKKDNNNTFEIEIYITTDFDLNQNRVSKCYPLQCSCLENPRDGGAWWAAVYGGHTVRHDWSDLAAAAAANVTFIWDHKMKDSSGGLVAKTLQSQCRGMRFHPWSRMLQLRVCLLHLKVLRVTTKTWCSLINIYKN